MKKIVAIFALLVVGILVEIAFFMPARKNPVITVEEGEMIVRVSTENGQQIIRPWLDERNGVYCFFFHPLSGETIFAWIKKYRMQAVLL